MNSFPRISIITPSYNQVAFIEQTILSILNQDYPDLEYIVMDGGSTDGTLEILKKYSERLTWISEPDRGQSHALNKGFRMATGEVLAFLNSDDLYEPGALIKVGHYFAEHPETTWLTGRCRIIDHDGKEIRKAVTAYKNFWLKVGGYRILQILNFISQPATFWRREVIEQVGLMDERLYYTMDYDYWLRIGQRSRLFNLNQNLAFFRVHLDSKTGGSVSAQFNEQISVARRYTSSKILLELHAIHITLTSFVYSNNLKKAVE